MVFLGVLNEQVFLKIPQDAPNKTYTCPHPTNFSTHIIRKFRLHQKFLVISNGIPLIHYGRFGRFLQGQYISNSITLVTIRLGK